MIEVYGLDIRPGRTIWFIVGDGLIDQKEMRCFSDVVNGVWVFVEKDQRCMPQKEVPCDHACEKCPRDVDECEDGSHDCAIGQTCINHEGVAPGRIADRASFQVSIPCYVL